MGELDLYNQRPGFMKNLRTMLMKKYKGIFHFGAIYNQSTELTFFTCTPNEIKEHKLKIVLVCNYLHQGFELWLAGQNREIQHSWRKIFHESDWNLYHKPDLDDPGFSIVDTRIEGLNELMEIAEMMNHIEENTLSFIREMEKVILI